VTHLGYYETEEAAARVYDRVSLSLHGPHAQTNYPGADYSDAACAPFRGLNREELQRALGVKPMDKSSRCGAAARPPVPPGRAARPFARNRQRRGLHGPGQWHRAGALARGSPCMRRPPRWPGPCVPAEACALGPRASGRACAAREL